MADSAVEITAGTGTNIDTRTEGTNSNHRQVVVIGDPATNAGVAPVDATAGLKVDLGADNDVVVTNAGTFAVQAAQSGTWNVTVNAAIAAGDNNIGNVDIVTVPADPFGADADAASASGSISAKLRGIATALGITAFDLGSGTGGSRTLRFFKDTAQWIGGAGAVTSAVQRMTLASDDPAVAALQTLDNAISGSEMQVDVVAALPAGTNAIGKLAANSGVDIGDVDVTSIIPGTGATNLGKAEDAAHTSADVGVMALAVLTATPANRSGTDGDYEPLQVHIGHLWVAPPPVTKASVNFNRPANTTAYAANDAVNDNATAGGGSSTELSWAIGRSSGIIRRIRIKKTDQTVATPTIRLWLYDTVFASGAGDNEAFVHPATDAIGYVDVPVTTAGSDDAVGWADCDIPFTGATLYGQLQTLSAFTPASGETFTIGLWYLPG